MTQKNKTSTYTKGMEIRRQVLGIKHVENAIKNTIGKTSKPVKNIWETKIRPLILS